MRAAASSRFPTRRPSAKARRASSSTCTACSTPSSSRNSNARQKLQETDPNKLSDKIGRAFGILQNGYLLNSGEAMNLLSLIRLGIDLGVFPDGQRAIVDRLFIECQPGHVQHAAKGAFDPAQRDVLRAARLRSEFAKLIAPDFTNNSN